MKHLLIITAFLSSFLISEAQVVKYPFGAATVSTITANNDTLYAVSDNSVTFTTLSDTLIANTVMYATISSGVKAGDMLYIQASNGVVARTVTFKSTYFTAPTVTMTASKSKLFSFIYNGSKFVYVNSININ